MIRPPTPQDFFNPRESSQSDLYAYTESYWEMQEALTAEWLIEQGFMPDPSWAEKEGYFDLGYYDKDLGEFVTEFGEWTCEDTQNSKAVRAPKAKLSRKTQ